MEQSGHPVSHSQLREFVSLLNVSSGGQDCGHNWTQRFLKRRPELRAKMGTKIDTLRLKNTTPEKLRPWFDTLQALIRRIGVKPLTIWNVDETGIALGVCNSHTVLGTTATTKSYMQTPENREWVSIIECVSAIGKKIKPVVIFRGKSLQSSWFTPDKVPDFLYTSSENGWTSNAIAVEWLRRVFLPETNTNGAPRLLLLDNHGSHITVQFMKICWENNVTVFYLIPHSSHILQPLDLCPFSVVKSRYRDEISNLAALADEIAVKKNLFIEVYNKARNEGMTEYNIRAGWSATGIYPWDPQKVLRSSQVMKATNLQQIGLPTPQTPKASRFQHLEDATVVTPQNRHHLTTQFNLLVQTESVSRSMRMLVSKASKTIEIQAFKSVCQEQLLTAQASQLTHLQNKRKKKVTIDSNAMFADIADIIRVQEEVEARKAEYDKKDTAKQARLDREEMIKQGIGAFLYEYHVADDVNKLSIPGQL